VERSTSRVLSALSAGCDSALLRNGWDALNLVQPGEPMWKPYTRRLLLLKPLLIARTLLNGILITVIFYSKKVSIINWQAISRQHLPGNLDPATTCSLPSLSLRKAAAPTTSVKIPNTLVWLQTTIGSSTITTRPELSLADKARESLFCGEILDVVKPSTLTCVTPSELTLYPLEVPEGLGSMDTTPGSTKQ